MANKIQIRRGNKLQLPSLDKGEPAVALDTSEVFIGGNSGNIQIATKALTDQISSEVAALSKEPEEYEWVATEGQLVYDLPAGKTYDPTSKWTTLIVGGAELTLSMFEKTSSTRFTLLVDSSDIVAGIKVVAKWFAPTISAVFDHHTTHEIGGQDEIDVTLLKNYQTEISDKIGILLQNGVNPRWSPFNAKFDGVTDDSAAIQAAINFAVSNGIYKVILPRTSTPAMISLSTPLMIPSGFTLEGIGDKPHLKAIASSSRNFDVSVTGGDEKFVYGRGALVVGGDLGTGKAFTRTAMGSNITIRNVNIDGNQASITKTGLNTKGNHHGIYIQFTKGLLIEKCKIENCLGSGIYSYVNSDVIVRNNKCNYNGQLPFVTTSRNGITVGGSDVDIIENAVVEGNTCVGNLNAGIMYGCVNRVIIKDNILIDNLHKGIEGDNNNASTSLTIKTDVIVSDNFVINTLMTGIDLSAGNNGKIKVSGNKVISYGNTGIFVQQNNDSIANIYDNQVLEGAVGLTGNTTNGSTTITNVSNIYYWQQENAGVGATIVGDGIPAGATVTAIDAVNNTLTISAAATVTATGVAIATQAYNAVTIVGHVANVHDNVIRKHRMGHGISVTRAYKFKAHDNDIEDTWSDAINITLTSKQDAEVNNIGIIDNNFKTIGANALTVYVSNAAYKVRSLKIQGNNALNLKSYSTFTKYGYQIRNNTTIDSMVVNGNNIIDTNATAKASQGLQFETTASCARAIVSNNDFTGVLTAEIGNSSRITTLKAKNNFNITDTV